jgi:hypothetical protein
MHLALRSLTAALVLSSLASLATIAALARSEAGDGCELPAGASLLDPQAQAAVAQHVLACRDLEHHRITVDDYKKLIGATRAQPTQPAILWASRVVAVSSEYNDTTWAARQVLGPPDVYPRHGDLGGAWASKEPDAGDEFIEVAFERPVRAQAVRVYETFNPGAVSQVELVTSMGRRIDSTAGRTIADRSPQGATVESFDLECTSEPIASVRLRLASGAVPGWNELDAIGIVPCP